MSVNQLLSHFFQELSIALVDFKLEFGIDEKGKICLGDEITPDSCRLWEKKSHNPLDKDLFRFNLGDVLNGYKVLSERLGIRI